MITILGPTATGKTSLAANLASLINGEIISADSRQVYRGMDIGTGKDLDDYNIDGRKIPYHLVDIVEPGYEYNVFEFQKDFLKAYATIDERGSIPILCGGTGLYIESVLKGYKLIDVPKNDLLREELELKDEAELIEILETYKNLHNTTDTSERERLIRAIEIQKYYDEHPDIDTHFPKIDTKIFGISYDRRVVRMRITERLEERLQNGMIEEVEGLLSSGVKPDQLTFYGLEYKWVTDYLEGKLAYNEMFRRLNTAIHQFSKRQMTWFRRMEKQGFEINWIDGNLNLPEKIAFILQNLPN
ncbi:MAG: tRNA (adenosine(37)-N6)-dimethylallyltransferase MiaA [Bacteroidales bacterium]|nr:tRNA (adenosine(37)-N6)-dimethylallyltransferase MiaA [Bacteroidales bacterium]RLD37663.1 MAG: tRNA (adenosine(37)-N6)-dimethylallyltransferase MiaA [Bacteroidota bacterium]